MKMKNGSTITAKPSEDKMVGAGVSYTEYAADHEEQKAKVIRALLDNLRLAAYIAPLKPGKPRPIQITSKDEIKK